IDHREPGAAMSVLPGRGRFLLAVLIAYAVTSTPRGHAQPPAAHRPVAVFAADGAGNFRVASMMLRQVVEEDELPIEVYSFEWSHGYARVLSDQVAFSHARDKGKHLAEQV